MILKSLHRLLFVVAVLALEVPLYAAETITHQGRLLDATDKPVADGTYSATFSLWDDPVAGNMVWSEPQDIQTKSGLFSAELGKVSSFFDIFTEFADRDLYLQVQVQVSGSTETLSPRLRIGSAPFASTSRRVHAIHAGPDGVYRCSAGATDGGAAVVLGSDSDNDGVPERKFQTLSNASKVACVISADLDDDGVPDRSIDEDCDGVAASFRIRKRPELLYQAWDDGIQLSVDDNSSSSVIAQDLDRDGIPDLVVSSSCDATSAKHAVKTKGTGAQSGRSASVSSTTTESSASSVCTLDLDGNGIVDRAVGEVCDDASSSRSMSFFDVFTETKIDDDCDATGARRRLSSGNIGSSGQDGVSVSMLCSPDSAVESSYVRKNGALHSADYNRKTPFSNSRISSFFDVFTELSIADSIDATGAVRKLSSHNLGSSGQDGVEMTARPNGSAGVRCDNDSDGDGVPESELALSVGIGATGVHGTFTPPGMAHPRTLNELSTSSTESRTSMAADLDGDGSPDVVVMGAANDVSASQMLGKKGLNAVNVKLARTISSTVDDVGAVQVIDDDSDDDGVMDRSISSSCDATGAKHAITTKGTGSAGRVASVASTTTGSSASSACGIDLDGDGVADSQIEQRCTPDSVVQVAEIGGGGSGSSYNMRTRINELETKLTNVGLLGTGRAMQACGDGSASVSCDIDVDNNSTVDGTAWQKVDNTGASCGASTDSNHDGTPDVTASVASSTTRSELKGTFQSGDVPTQSQFSTLLDSDGARSLLSGGMSGSTTGTIRMSATPDSTVFDLGYHGSTTGTIRLMASSSGSENPIEHSSGAHLTPGGVWTNASDVNLKENFQPVDGEKILDKIEQLPISQWNYKNESDKVTHIGPTAQDFKAAFGVGDNDKSISTIDPSGIALVAVKELRKENQELKTQVAELKKMVEELAKKN